MVDLWVCPVTREHPEDRFFSCFDIDDVVKQLSKSRVRFETEQSMRGRRCFNQMAHSTAMLPRSGNCGAGCRAGHLLASDGRPGCGALAAGADIGNVGVLEERALQVAVQP